jgi:hypothetical protein
MIDVREDILARLLEVVATIPNVRTVQRNDPDLDEVELPAVVVLDGDEETDENSVQKSGPAHLPMLVRMSPKITLAQQAEEVGSDLTTLRRELIKRVLYDPELIAKTGTNGAIRYLGCTTDFGWLRYKEGTCEAQFMFKYPLKPDDL